MAAPKADFPPKSRSGTRTVSSKPILLETEKLPRRKAKFGIESVDTALDDIESTGKPVAVN